MSDPDRLPPQNLDAERAVLGSILIDNDLLADVLALLRADDFYSPDHKIIFEAMVALSDAGTPIDLVTLTDKLRADEMLDRVGGPATLADILERTPSAANGGYYAGLVATCAYRRRLIQAGTQIVRSGYDLSLSADEMAERADQALFATAERRAAVEALSIRDILSEVLAGIEDMQSNQITGLRTHLHDLDDITCGLQKSDVIIIAGRPSMGKTTLAINIGMRVSLGGWPIPDYTSGLPVLIFSLEMHKAVLARNMLCSMAKVDSHKMRRGLLHREEIERLPDAARQLGRADLIIDDTPLLTISDLRVRARRCKMRNPKLALVIVDYLQLMAAPGQENRQQEISAISRGLKALARELNLPVVALSQLSRATEAREGHVPRMSDLRESGSLEQDSDVIVLVYREEQYQPGSRPGEADLIVAKQRNGPTGTVTVTFQRQYLRFENFIERGA